MKFTLLLAALFLPVFIATGQEETSAAQEPVAALKARGMAVTVPELMETAKHLEGEVRHLALAALHSIATQDDLPALIALLETWEDPACRSALERTLAAAAGRGDPKAGTAVLLEALRNTKATLTASSIHRVLGIHGDEDTLPLLEEAARRGNAAAIESLGLWPSIAPEELLRALVIEAATPELKELAMNGYIRVLRMPHETPAEKTAARFKEALSLAVTVQQKRAILAGLSELPAAHALPVVEAYLQDPELGETAEAAVQRLRRLN